MPSIHLTAAELSEDGARVAQLKIWSYMLWPTNAGERFRFIGNETYHFARSIAASAGASLTLEPAFLSLDLVHENPVAMAVNANPDVLSPPVSCPEATRSDGATIAARILQYALELQLEGENNITLQRCIDFVRAEVGNTKNAGQRSFEKLWAKWRSVSHLWLAVPAQHVIGETFCQRLLVADDARRHGEQIRVEKQPSSIFRSVRNLETECAQSRPVRAIYGPMNLALIFET